MAKKRYSLLETGFHSHEKVELPSNKSNKLKRKTIKDMAPFYTNWLQKTDRLAY